MADKDKKLVAALNDAKKRKMYFAFIPKGASDGKLIVSKKKVPKKEIDEAKQELKVNIALTGKCSGPPDNLVFEVAKEPSGGVGNAIKAVTKRDAAITVKPEFKVVTDADAELPPAPEDEGTESQGEEVPSAPPVPPSGAKKTVDPIVVEAMQKVTNRLEVVLPQFKEAIGANAPDAGQIKTLMASVKEAATKQKYDDASTALDQLEPLLTKFMGQQKLNKDKAVAKKTEVDKKMVATEKAATDPVFADLITENKEKLKLVQKMIDPPENKYNDALQLLTGIETSVGNIATMAGEYAKVLKHKDDTDKKIARMEKDKQKALITADIATAKSDEKKAMALAGPPKFDFTGAIKGLGAVDKFTAKAEVKILDALVKGKSRDEMAKKLKEVFKDRFGVNLKMESKGDNQAQELESMKRIYELMAQVPETHATNNPSFKKLDRIGGDADTSYYQSEKTILGFIKLSEKKIVLNCERPTTSGTELNSGLKANPAGGFDPPIDPDCQPNTPKTTQSYFDWTTLHEIAHAIDDQKNFMNSNGSKPEFGGWKEYGEDVSSIAKVAADHFKFNTKEAITYIENWLKTRAAPGAKPAAPTGRADWDTVRGKVDAWCGSITVDKNPWSNMPDDIGGRIYHEAYGKSWVSYLKAARSKAITGYQFRAPGEWFSELYAAYHSGVLKDSHPMVKSFLRDL